MPARITIDQRSLRFTIFHLNRANVSVQRAERLAIDAAGTVLYDKISENITLRDHTLSQLADLDHPYARRHGTIRLAHGRIRGQMRDTRHAVHSQSHRVRPPLLASSTRSAGGGAGYRIAIDLVSAPHWRWVIEGTRTMLPRDPLFETALSKPVQKEMKRAILQVLGPVLRSQGGVRFGGLPPGATPPTPPTP